MAHMVHVTNDMTQTVKFLVRSDVSKDQAIEAALSARRHGVGESVSEICDDNMNARMACYLGDDDGDVETLGEDLTASDAMMLALKDCLSQANCIHLNILDPDGGDFLPEEQLIFEMHANQGTDSDSSVIALMDLDQVRYLMSPCPIGITDNGFQVQVWMPGNETEKYVAFLRPMRKEVITQYREIKPGFVVI